MLTILLALAVGQTFERLGDLPGGNNYSEGFAISADGRTAVGQSDVGGSGFLRQMAGFAHEGWIFPIAGGEGSSVSAAAYAVSADGSSIVGVIDFGGFSSEGRPAFLYRRGFGLEVIGDLEGGDVPRAVARGISGDGMIVVGVGESHNGTEAFRYDVATRTFLGLGALPGPSFGSWAFGVSADGGTIVGTSKSFNGFYEAFRWTESEGMVGLGVMPAPPGVDPWTQAFAASADGRVIVGTGVTERAPGGEAFIWTAEGGFEPLGDLDGGAFNSQALAVSADGFVVVGRGYIAGTCGPFGCGSQARAFVWDRLNGMRDLQVLLLSLGADLGPARLDVATGVSADGRTVVGTCFVTGASNEAFKAHLPTTCDADFNGDGQVDFFDYLDFVAAFAAEDPSADFNRDGQIDFFDYLDFVQAFAFGCD